MLWKKYNIEKNQNCFRNKTQEKTGNIEEFGDGKASQLTKITKIAQFLYSEFVTCLVSPYQLYQEFSMVKSRKNVSSCTLINVCK